MLPFDLSQYSVTARNDLCMALYRMTAARLSVQEKYSEDQNTFERSGNNERQKKNAAS